MTLHTTGDELVEVEEERAYANVVQKAHDNKLLRQVFVNRAYHCNFTDAEMIAALGALISRLDTGSWSEVDPKDLNEAALKLGPEFNFFPPAFIKYEPAPFLRPFELACSSYLRPLQAEFEQAFY